MTFWRLLIILSLSGVGYYFFQDTREVMKIESTISNILNFNKIKYRNGVLVNSVPLQRAYRGSSITKAKHTIEPVAVFAARGRVLGVERYRFDREANLAPYDIILGWKEMSDEQVLEKVSFRQGFRFYDYDYEIQGMPVRLISHNSANIHLIPANNNIENIIGNLREGEMIFISGKLVNVRGSGSWFWKTSTSRTDLGDNSTEILYVEKITILTDKYPRVK